MAPSSSSSSTSPLYSPFTASPSVEKDHYRSNPKTILCQPSTTLQTTTTTTPSNPLQSIYSYPTKSPAAVKDVTKTMNENDVLIPQPQTTSTTSPISLQGPVVVVGATIPRQANGRALRRRRTVAFAVNHERTIITPRAPPFPQPSIVSTHNNLQTYSGARSALLCAQDSTCLVKTPSTCQQAGARANENSHCSRDSPCRDVQQPDETSSTKAISKSTTTINDVRSAPLSITMPTTATTLDANANANSNTGPAPITPVNIGTTTAVTVPPPTTMLPIPKRKRGRPSKKAKLLYDAAAAAAAAAAAGMLSGTAAAAAALLPPPPSPPPQPKLQRVKYDMEAVPPVQLNQKLWQHFRQQFQQPPATHQNVIATSSTTVSPVSLPKPIFSFPSSPSSLASLPLVSSSKNEQLFSDSVFWIPSSRKEWEDTISEMKSVCTSAAYRRWFKEQTTTSTQTQTPTNNHNNHNNNTTIATVATKNKMIPSSSSVTSHVNPKAVAKNPKAVAKNVLATNTNITTSTTDASVFHPPMSQAFIKDRIKYDDPLRGYQIRHQVGGWLQGFIIYTTMNLWTQEFQWNSTHPNCCLPAEIELEKEKVSRRRRRIDDGTLSTELEALDKSEPDPIDGGIVLHGVAEISLLGGLGCGELLLRKAIEDIRASDQHYKYVVMQATTGSRPFYEKYGFVRVGAICRYRWSGGVGYGANTTTTTTTKAAAAAAASKGHGKESVVPDRVTSASVPSPSPPPTDTTTPTTTTTPSIPPGEIQGYRHWTYTNESAISLDLHGGPSIMMCLRLADLDNDNEEEEMRDPDVGLAKMTTTKKTKNGTTLSELLAPHVVTEKPVIQPLGNVKLQNNAMNQHHLNGSSDHQDHHKPTRKSSRTGKGKQTTVVDLTVGATATTTTSLNNGGDEGQTTISSRGRRRRESKRAKRGRNSAFHNSDYVVYGDAKNGSASASSAVAALSVSASAVASVVSAIASSSAASSSALASLLLSSSSVQQQPRKQPQQQPRKQPRKQPQQQPQQQQGGLSNNTNSRKTAVVKNQILTTATSTFTNISNNTKNNPNPNNPKRPRYTPSNKKDTEEEGVSMEGSGSSIPSSATTPGVQHPSSRLPIPPLPQSVQQQQQSLESSSSLDPPLPLPPPYVQQKIQHSLESSSSPKSKNQNSKFDPCHSNLYDDASVGQSEQHPLESSSSSPKSNIKKSKIDPCHHNLYDDASVGQSESGSVVDDEPAVTNNSCDPNIIEKIIILKKKKNSNDASALSSLPVASNTTTMARPPSHPIITKKITKQASSSSSSSSTTTTSVVSMMTVKPKRDGNGRFIINKKKKKEKKKKQTQRQQKVGSTRKKHNSITAARIGTDTTIATDTVTTKTIQEKTTSLASVVAAATVNALSVIHNNNNNNNNNTTMSVNTLHDDNQFMHKTLFSDRYSSRQRRREAPLNISSTSSLSYTNETDTVTTKKKKSTATENLIVVKSSTTSNDEMAMTKTMKRTTSSVTTTPKCNTNEKKKRRKITSMVQSLSTPSSSLPSASSWQKQASTYLEGEVDAVGGGKRVRQSFIPIDKTKLCKQKVKSYPRSRIHYYNKVVIRKRSSNVVDDDPRCDSRNSTAKSPTPRRYNGGSMIDHRYEYCFYFVLHYEEATSKIVLVPMIRNGLFMTGSKNRVGRFRYQCNILDNNKNWIVQDAGNTNIFDEYDVVMDATMIMKTSLVAQEAWDIYSNEEEA